MNTTRRFPVVLAAVVAAAAYHSALASPLRLAQSEARQAIEEAKEAVRGVRGEVRDVAEEALKAAEAARTAVSNTPGAQTTERGDVINLAGDVEIAADQTVEGDVVAMGGTAHVRGKVKGNVVSVNGGIHLYEGADVAGDAIAIGGDFVRDSGARVAGSRVKIGAPWSDQLAPAQPAEPAEPAQPSEPAEPARPSTEVHHSGDKVTHGGSVRVEENEVVDGSVVSFGGSADVLGQVNGDVVSFGGSIDVEGEVSGDAVSFGGSVRLHPGAKVGGDAVAMGGKVVEEEGSELGGEGVSFSVPFGGLLGKPWAGIAPKPRPSRLHATAVQAGKWLGATLGLLVIAVLLALVLPRHTDVIATSIAQEPARALWYGLVGWLLVTPILVILCVLVITWILIPFYIAAIIALVAVGAVGVYILVGRHLSALAKWPVQSVVALSAMGLLVLRLVDLIEFLPYGGHLAFIITMAVLIFALGGALMTGFGRDPSGTWLAQRLSNRTRHAPVQPATQQPPAQPLAPAPEPQQPSPDAPPDAPAAPPDHQRPMG
ncbi:MAG: hypothetical protein ACE5R4_17055 [Armatimonadota bacterium]